MPTFDDAEGGLSVRTKINAAITVVDTLSDRGADKNLVFNGRTAFVAWVADGGAAPDGSIASDGTVQYVAAAGEAALPGLGGWLPFGRVSGKHFGAVGDGVTDDQVAVQAASDFCAAQSVELYFAPGTYRFDSVVNLSSNSVWVGDADLATITKDDGATHDLVNGVSVNDLSITGIGFDGKRRNGGGVTGQSLRFRGSNRIRVSGCRFYDGMNVFVEEGCDDVLVTENKFALGKYGIGVGGHHNGVGTGLFVSNIVISNNHFRETETEAIDLNRNVARAVIDGNVLRSIHTVSETGNEAIDIGGGTHEDITVTGNVIDLGGFASSGINIKEACTRVSVVGNTISGGNVADTEGRGIRSTGGSTNVTISGNVVSEVFRGISVDNGCSDVSVTGNSIDAQDQGIAVGAGSNERISITSNTVTTVAGVRDGISVANCDGFSIAGNMVSGATGQGIEAAISSTNGVICNNTVTGCDDGINVASSDTIVDGNVCFENDDKGIQVQAEHVTISNNIARDNGQGSVSYGIRVEAGSNFCVITGNQVYDTQATKTQQGLSFGGASDRCIVQSNMLYDNDSGVNITGQGSLTNSIVADNITA